VEIVILQHFYASASVKTAAKIKNNEHRFANNIPFPCSHLIIVKKQQ